MKKAENFNAFDEIIFVFIQWLANSISEIKKLEEFFRAAILISLKSGRKKMKRPVDARY